MKTRQLIENSNDTPKEMHWMMITIIISVFLMFFLDSNKIGIFSESISSHNMFFGLSKVLEFFVFFSFSAFVVFGIKGFFEMYSHKRSNLILLVSGGTLVLLMVFLSYQILFEL